MLIGVSGSISWDVSILSKIYWEFIPNAQVFVFGFVFFSSPSDSTVSPLCYIFIPLLVQVLGQKYELSRAKGEPGTLLVQYFFLCRVSLPCSQQVPVTMCQCQPFSCQQCLVTAMQHRFLCAMLGEQGREPPCSQCPLPWRNLAVFTRILKRVEILPAAVMCSIMKHYGVV